LNIYDGISLPRVSPQKQMCARGREMSSCWMNSSDGRVRMNFDLPLHGLLALGHAALQHLAAALQRLFALHEHALVRPQSIDFGTQRRYLFFGRAYPLLRQSSGIFSENSQ